MGVGEGAQDPGDDPAGIGAGLPHVDQEDAVGGGAQRAPHLLQIVLRHGDRHRLPLAKPGVDEGDRSRQVLFRAGIEQRGMIELICGAEYGHRGHCSPSSVIAAAPFGHSTCMTLRSPGGAWCTTMPCSSGRTAAVFTSSAVPRTSMKARSERSRWICPSCSTARRSAPSQASWLFKSISPATRRPARSRYSVMRSSPSKRYSSDRGGSRTRVACTRTSGRSPTACSAITPLPYGRCARDAFRVRRLCGSARRDRLDAEAQVAMVSSRRIRSCRVRSRGYPFRHRILHPWVMRFPLAFRPPRPGRAAAIHREERSVHPLGARDAERGERLLLFGRVHLGVVEGL